MVLGRDHPGADRSVVAAEIAVNWHGVRFSFTTRNPKRRPTWLAVMLERGPFRRFEGNGASRRSRRKPARSSSCWGTTSSTRSPVRSPARVFDEIAGTFVDAYVARADKLYGG